MRACSFCCVLALLLGFFVPGCTSSTYSGTTAAPTQRVDVYHSEAEVSRPHTSMGTIETTASPSMSLKSIEAELMNQARQRGADAIIVDKVALETVGYQTQAAGGEQAVPAKSAGAADPQRAIREQVVTARLIKYTG